MDPSLAAAKISHLAAMGNERTALDRVDGIVSRVELYFENPAAENVFCDSRGRWKLGPAVVFSKAVVAGLAPPEFKLKVQSKLDMIRGVGRTNLTTFSSSLGRRQSFGARSNKRTSVVAKTLSAESRGKRHPLQSHPRQKQEREVPLRTSS